MTHSADLDRGGVLMGDSNMPTLWQNCLTQFSTEVARKAWVWFAETRGTGMQYAADAYAREVELLYLSHCKMAALSAHKLDDENMDDLTRFILIRHANYRLGANVKPYFLRAAQ